MLKIYKYREDGLTKLQRTTFKASRAAEYVEAHQLQAVTGQPKGKFAAVVVKELVDNALDACETAGQPPAVELEVERADGAIRLAVSDNGSGIPPETVRAALDFDVRVSDKAAYRSPTRGAQGNALKTVFGIPPALGSLEPVVVEARGLRHEVRLWKDPAGELRVQCDEAPGSRDGGTRVALSIPEVLPKQGFDPEYWARAAALFNPHAAVKIRGFEASDLVNPRRRFSRILTTRPGTRPSASSTYPATRRVLTGTTCVVCSASSTPTSS